MWNGARQQYYNADRKSFLGVGYWDKHPGTGSWFIPIGSKIYIAVGMAYGNGGEFGSGVYPGVNGIRLSLFANEASVSSKVITLAELNSAPKDYRGWHIFGIELYNYVMPAFNVTCRAVMQVIGYEGNVSSANNQEFKCTLRALSEAVPPSQPDGSGNLLGNGDTSTWTNQNGSGSTITNVPPPDETEKGILEKIADWLHENWMIFLALVVLFGIVVLFFIIMVIR